MEEGVLCLKWRDHRSTFLHMLASTRKKGAFCDATLVCEGKFYPVHQLVLSTCSEYFQEVFATLGSRTCQSPGLVHAALPLVVVLTGVSPRDLEALLEYIYVGEATVLQGELSHFMRAAEGLKIRGLAEKTSAAQRSGPESAKRPASRCGDAWVGKRKKECVGSPETHRQRSLEDVVCPAQLAAVELAPDEHCATERDMATGTPGDLPGAAAPLSPPVCPPQVKYEEVQVKCEPQPLEDEEEEEEEKDWSHYQEKRQPQHKSLGDGGDTAQLLGFCDPGLTYLAHSTGLGALADPGHPPHHPPILHPRRMGRPTSEIWLHYITERSVGKTAVYCRYCAQKYGYPNATKMKIHTMKCSKCPDEVKTQFEGMMKPDSSEGQDVTLGRPGLEMGAAAKTDSAPHAQFGPSQLQQGVERSNEVKDATGRAKAGHPRSEAMLEGPAISLGVTSQSAQSSSPTKSDAPTRQQAVSAVKSKQRQYPGPERSAPLKASSLGPEKAHTKTAMLSSKATPQQQHLKPSSQTDDRVTLRSEHACHPPVL